MKRWPWTSAIWPFLERADSEFRPLQVREDADGSAGLILDRADEGVAGAMLGVARVAEVEAEHVHAGLEQRADGRLVGARWPEGRDDLGAAVASHRLVPLRCARLLYRHAAAAGQRLTRMARKSFTLVSVGPVITRSPSRAKKP